MSGHQLATLDVEFSENWKANVELGTDIEAAMVSWSANEKAAFRLGARTFYMKYARYLPEAASSEELGSHAPLVLGA